MPIFSKAAYGMICAFLRTVLSEKSSNGSQLLPRTDAVTYAPCWIRTSDRLLRRQLQPLLLHGI